MDEEELELVVESDPGVEDGTIVVTPTPPGQPDIEEQVVIEYAEDGSIESWHKEPVS